MNRYESRVILALLRRGSASSIDLAALSGVPRTSVYPVLEALGDKGLVERLPGPGPAVWACAGHQVLERLSAAEEERLRRHRERTGEMRRLLEPFLAQASEVALPFVHLLPRTTQARLAHQELVGLAETEVAMCTQPASTWAFPNLSRAVLDALTRGIDVRVLYEAAQWDDPSAEAFRAEMARYHQAGVRARLSHELPVSLVVVDRRAALVSMPHPAATDGSPTTLHIEHPGFAEVAATTFDRYWADARRLPPGPVVADQGGLVRRVSSAS